MTNDAEVRTGRTAADLDQVAAAGTAAPAAGATATDLEQSAVVGAVAASAMATSATAVPGATTALIDDLEEALRDVVDPELGVNIVDLGLLYDLQVGADNVATIDMTLTSAACPLTDMIEEQVAAALLGEPALVEDFRINWVWLPPWGPERITEDGRDQLRALGFNI